MLTRFVTFFAVAPIVFVFILYDIPPYGIIPFVMLMAAVVVLAVNEFFSISYNKKQNPYEIIGYVVSLALVLSTYMKETWIIWNSRWGLLFSLIAIFIFIYELLKRNVLAADNKLWLTLRSIVYIGWLYSFIVLIRGLEHGFAYLIYLALTIAACDTTAYLFGIKFGRNRLAPLISPKKSVEGSVAGLVAAILASYLLGAHYLGARNALVMGLIIGFFGQIGDLFESLLKRRFDVKDSGWILPGHGGIMDRMDSAIFVAPLIYYYLVMVVLE